MVRTPGHTTQSRAWTFTDYNLDRLSVFWKSISCKDLWVGYETCPSTNRKHLQGMVVWLRPYRESQLKKLVPGAHWEPAKMVDAENYSMKEDLVVSRHMSEDDVRRRLAERQWTGKDFRDAVTRDVADGVCNRCLFDRYAGFMFAQADRVFTWRYYKRYAQSPPWKKDEWCQQCGYHYVRQGFDVAPHDCLTCSSCGIKGVSPPQAQNA